MKNYQIMAPKRLFQLRHYWIFELCVFCDQKFEYMTTLLTILKLLPSPLRFALNLHLNLQNLSFFCLGFNVQNHCEFFIFYQGLLMIVMASTCFLELMPNHLFDLIECFLKFLLIDHRFHRHCFQTLIIHHHFDH